MKDCLVVKKLLISDRWMEVYRKEFDTSWECSLAAEILMDFLENADTVKYSQFRIQRIDLNYATDYDEDFDNENDDESGTCLVS